MPMAGSDVGEPTPSSTFPRREPLALMTYRHSFCDHALKCRLLGCVGKQVASCLPTVGAWNLTYM